MCLYSGNKYVKDVMRIKIDKERGSVVGWIRVLVLEFEGLEYVILFLVFSDCEFK